MTSTYEVVESAPLLLSFLLKSRFHSDLGRFLRRVNVRDTWVVGLLEVATTLLVLLILESNGEADLVAGMGLDTSTASGCIVLTLWMLNAVECSVMS